MGATPRIVAVVVTYQPDPAACAELLKALTPQVARVIIVDNGSRQELLDPLRELVTALGPTVELRPLPSNRGIGAAQNVGIAVARADGADLVLLSDQDSVPAPDMVQRLVVGLQRASGDPGHPVAAVGPVTVDERADGATLLFAATRWGPRRAALPDVDGALVPVAFLVASGCLVTRDALDAVGGMNEPWFIDHVDLEWGLRAARLGYALYGVVGAELRHQLGDRTVKLPGRGRDVHIHSPVRNYYMTRNTVHLIRSGLLGPAWALGYVAWITKYAAFYVLAVAPRGTRAALMARGFADGLRGRTGPLPGARRRRR